MTKFIWVLLLSGGLLSLAGCDKEEESIPSYIYITKFDFYTDYATHGPPSSNIEDVVVIVDNKEYGTFTLPAMVPINEKGTVDVILFPGIRVNGGSQNRKVYGMYTSYKTTIDLEPKLIDTLKPVTTYKSNVKLVWSEDFEDNGLRIRTSGNNSSEDSIQFIDSSSTEAFKSDYSEFTGYINMNTTDSQEVLEYETMGLWNVPNGDNDVFLECDYKTNTNIQFGIYADKVAIYEQIGIFVVSPTEGEWKKIYINLNSETGVLESSDKIRIFFGVFNDGEKKPGFVPEIYLDNLKLVHLN